MAETESGSRYFCEVCFGHPSPAQQQKLNATIYAYGASTSCVRCVITLRGSHNSSVTLRRHKAVLHLFVARSRSQLRICRRRRLSRTNRLRFIHGGQRLAWCETIRSTPNTNPNEETGSYWNR
ncbi:hypothetical protein [Candidatus Reidiella endopervernicosa]|uniref:Uncharacterized protein n=1 Tax=Candidatus Reidiella endopervernicosa TaxID=2738883 RepID=A0A6N0HVZ1_9GAMM|nr:hypothetical protein [Candidatus Reidiella endopervernicosa]QKQ26520.1 hypothetical protein HUE57_09685 [Candidatus Reidiella endopervernicosa]